VILAQLRMLEYMLLNEKLEFTELFFARHAS